MYSDINELLNRLSNESQYDTAAKEILKDKILLSNILQPLLPELRSYNCEDVVKFLSEPKIASVPLEFTPKIDDKANESKIPNEGSVFFDIVFDLHIPAEKDPIKIIIDIEAQKNPHPGYDLVTRGFFYCARLVSSQLNRDFVIPKYNQISKTYSIWICMNEGIKNANTITRYHIDKTPILGNYEGEERYDLMEVIMIRIGNIPSRQKGVAQLLSIIYSKYLSIDEKTELLKGNYDLHISQSSKEVIGKMSNLGEGIREQDKLDDIIILMDYLKCPFEKAAEILRVPKDNIDYMRTLYEDRIES